MFLSSQTLSVFYLICFTLIKKMGILCRRFWWLYMNLLIIFVVRSVSWTYSLFMLISYLYSSLKETRDYPKELCRCQFTLSMQEILLYKFPDNVAHFAL
jgi:hypothetical protein